MSDFAELHAPHAALLQTALATATPPGAAVALDLGCGAGAKTPWLTTACAPGALVLGLDLDQAALRAAWEHRSNAYWVAADAHSLPLRSKTLHLVWCIAALALFAEPSRALGEIARALAPGGHLVVATATTRWVRRRIWPPTQVLPRVPPPADDLGADLQATLTQAGLTHVSLAAYLLNPPGLAPTAALLPLADLSPLKPLAVEEPEALPVLLVVGVRSQEADGCR